MKMSRARYQELTAHHKIGPSLFYAGPQNTGHRFMQTGAPKTIEDCGALEDTSDWLYDRIDVEPAWVIQWSEALNRWSVHSGEPGDPFAALNGVLWKSRERAEEYLALALEDWWAE